MLSIRILSVEVRYLGQTNEQIFGPFVLLVGYRNSVEFVLGPQRRHSLRLVVAAGPGVAENRVATHVATQAVSGDT